MGENKVVLGCILGEHTLVWGIRKEITFKLEFDVSQRGKRRLYQAVHIPRSGQK